MGTDFERNALAGLRHFSKSAIVKWDDIAEGIGSMTDSRELLTPRDLDLQEPAPRLNPEVAATHIIAIVREALLRKEAVQASIRSAGNELVGVYVDAEDMLSAALNAAFDPDKD